jgi:hypothetical protein
VTFNVANMPPIISKLKNKKLHSQTREVISNVIQFMEIEATQDNLVIPIKQAQKRAAEATGVSLSSVEKIKREKKLLDTNTGESSFPTPDKKKGNALGRFVIWIVLMRIL